MQVTLRDYQTDAVAALSVHLDRGLNPLCVLPTGSGKSLVIAGLIAKRKQRALVLSHVSELLDQDAKALRRLDPSITMSFFAAGLGEKNAGAQVVFGSVQSVYRNLDRFKKSRPLVIVDEAHLCPRSGDAMYAQVFDHFQEARRSGFTATALRVDSGSLIDGDDAWFNSVAHKVEVAELIEKGWLLPLSGVIAEQQANLESVGTRNGDFIQGEMQQAVSASLSLPEVVARTCELAAKRKSWLVFACGVDHAHDIEGAFLQHGIDAEVVIGATDDDVRSKRVERFRTGELRCLINVGVLTTGFDAPGLDCIVSMRPTKSPVLWQQMLGRGMRIAQGKKNCLLLDFVGNLERLGGAGCVIDITDQRLPTDLREKEKRLIARKMAKRKLPVYFDASGRDPMMSGDSFDAEVKGLRFFLADSRTYPGKRLIVGQYTLQDQFARSFKASFYLCVEYSGFPWVKACEWFGRRGIIQAGVPRDCLTAKALAESFDLPVEVAVRRDERAKAYVVEHERFAAL